MGFFYLVLLLTPLYLRSLGVNFNNLLFFDSLHLLTLKPLILAPRDIFRILNFSLRYAGYYPSRQEFKDDLCIYGLLRSYEPTLKMILTYLKPPLYYVLFQ